jgi:hypothetical protein
MKAVENLDLPGTLGERIHASVDLPLQSRNFVLYLPTVVLRKRQNPAFALACRFANQKLVPLVVLAVVVDDAHLPTPITTNGTSVPPEKPIVFTARRIAFVLEALQEAAADWEKHGAGVAIRVHGPGCRTPHHLTLVRQACAVVTDEPFVHPYLSYVQSVERVALSCQTPVLRVDGSTTVPPICLLQRRVDSTTGKIDFQGAPKKAWIWQQRTDPKRRSQIDGAVRQGHLDAPDLNVKLDVDFFLGSNPTIQLPSDWRNSQTPFPGKRPFAVSELAAIDNVKEWVLTYPGVDATVLPCPQTHGTSGRARWRRFRTKHLNSYAKLRNNITRPHAVSRMSCFLNYGTVSIFDIIYDLLQLKNGCGSKYWEEIVKWREIGYVHALCFPESYKSSLSIPGWARNYLSQCRSQHDIVNNGYTLESLESCRSSDVTWNAMQSYLNATGELHNNARMTWGKTVIHWQKHAYSAEEILHHVVYLNDRYALDGLAPPSYAGLLWCFGWCDKADSTISKKPASRQYRFGPTDFETAQQMLLQKTRECSFQPSATVLFENHKPQETVNKKRKSQEYTSESRKETNLLAYFSPK